MAISYLIKHKKYVPTGLSKVNPVTSVALRETDDGETYAECVVKDINDATIATLRSTFVTDPNGNVLAYFDLSGIIRSLPKPQTILGTLRPQIIQQNYIIDNSETIAFFKTTIGGANMFSYACYAGLVPYNLFYQTAPDLVPNLQSDFIDYVIVADDFPDTPFYFGVDFNGEDFNLEDFN